MTADNIRIMCPSLTCRKILAVPPSSRGKNVRCKNCGATIRVPDRSTSAGPPAGKAPAPAAADAAAEAKPSAPKAA